MTPDSSIMKKDSSEIIEFQNEILEDSSSDCGADSRLLHVYFDNWKQNKAKIFDADKTTVLYTVDLKCLKPNLRFYSSDSDSQIGEVIFHFWRSSRIEATINGHEITLSSQGFTKSAYDFSSPSFGGSTLTWKSRRKCGNPMKLDLLNENGVAIAKFEPTNWAKKKAGKLELLAPYANSGQVMDEIVMTGVAVAHYRYQQMIATYGASAAVA